MELRTGARLHTYIHSIHPTHFPTSEPRHAASETNAEAQPILIEQDSPLLCVCVVSVHVCMYGQVTAKTTSSPHAHNHIPGEARALVAINIFRVTPVRLYEIVCLTCSTSGLLLRVGRYQVKSWSGLGRRHQCVSYFLLAF